MSKSKEVEFIQALNIQKMLNDWFDQAMKDGNDFVKGFLIAASQREEGREDAKKIGQACEAGFEFGLQVLPFAEQIFKAWIMGLISQIGKK